MIFLVTDVDFSVLKHFLKRQFQLYFGQNKSEDRIVVMNFSAIGYTQLDILILYFKMIFFSVYSNKMCNMCRSNESHNEMFKKTSNKQSLFNPNIL